MGCDLEKDKIDGALGLADPNTNASFKKDIISSKVVATPSIGLRIQGLSGPFKMSPNGLSLDNSCISPTVYRFEVANQQAKGTSVTPLEKLDVTILNPKFHSAIKNH
ncbi:hypothetical protein ERO13_A13G080266v2 [Gossypium hirsutum]|uniref:Uncharacterized protein n=2 Tax=Gossypium TaxID=3633 RepID=A0A5J5SWW2_GOSBA|nr:hypothetical protein ES319_A13G090400v1 [Gossypium barbadense]KAG4165508.1 hypothetical protein ERO13_A13G080266v2 [Gossypium hirsutum]TYG85937.1 hypothetical protein ES288_A13G094700v1 [Gossypium darwinii]